MTRDVANVTREVANAVGDLRQLIAKADAFATTADDLYEEIGNDRRRRERLAYLVTAAANAVRAALEAADKLAVMLATSRQGA